MKDTPQEAMIGDNAARELLASEKALQQKESEEKLKNTLAEIINTKGIV